MCGKSPPDVWDKGRILLLSRGSHFVRGSGGGRSVHSCLRRLPPTLRCDSGARKVCGTSPQDVWDQPTLGPDASAVSPFSAGPRSERASSLAQPFPRGYGVILWPARCVGKVCQMCGTSRHWGRILTLFRSFQLVRGRGMCGINRYWGRIRLLFRGFHLV